MIYAETNETIRALVRDQGLTQREVARRMGVSDARLSKALHQHENLTLRTLADLGWACGVRFEVVAVPLTDRVNTPAAEDPPPPKWIREHARLVAQRVRTAFTQLSG